MNDDELIGLFESLETSFSAASAAEDRAAADDLALSLQQDRLLRDVLLRGSWAHQAPVARTDVITGVGADYVELASGDLIPLADLVAVEIDAGPPEDLPGSLLETLRGWARAGAKAQVDGLNGRTEGLLVAVGRDHLMLATRQGRRLVALDAVSRISRLRGSSTGVA